MQLRDLFGEWFKPCFPDFIAQPPVWYAGAVDNYVWPPVCKAQLHGLLSICLRHFTAFQIDMCMEDIAPWCSLSSSFAVLAFASPFAFALALAFGAACDLLFGLVLGFGLGIGWALLAEAIA